MPVNALEDYIRRDFSLIQVVNQAVGSRKLNKDHERQVIQA